MKKRATRRLTLSRETLLTLDRLHLAAAVAELATLTVEPPCQDSDVCPPPGGCTSTLSCTL
jgi:hypothetical protein